MTLQAATVVKRSPHVPWRTIDGKGILVDLESGYYFSLNKTGQFIWGQIDGERNLAEIAHRVVEQFDVDESTALQDCVELAGRLQEQGLIVPVAS